MHHPCMDTTPSIDSRLLDFTKDQMQLAYAQYRSDREYAFKARNWCITVCLAVAALITTGKVSVNEWTRSALVLFPILLFWFSESMHMALARISIDHARKHQRVLLGLDSPSPEHLLDTFAIECTFKNTSLRDKHRAFFEAAFTTETLGLFYLLMAVGMLFLVLITRP
jgi:hypothetical protein